MGSSSPRARWSAAIVVASVAVAAACGSDVAGPSAAPSETASPSSDASSAFPSSRTPGTVFDGLVFVQYGQFYVEAGDHYRGDVDATFRGQHNGLLGAATPGHLHLTTGLHTGDVGLVVQVLDAAPRPGRHEDVVEASFVPEGAAEVLDWDGEQVVGLRLEVGASYRVRYSADGMDEGGEVDSNDPGDPVTDRYLLQLWPAPPAADGVLETSSEQAAYWNSAWPGMAAD